MIPLAVLGTSLFAPEVVDLADDTGRYVVRAFIENWDIEKTRRPFLERPVVWIDEAAALASTHEAICALGTTERRGFIDRVRSAGFRFARIVHPTSRVSRTSAIGEGCIVSAGVIIATQAVIGEHAILNRGVMVGHDTKVGSYTTLSPGANIAGAVTIGEGAYIGIGAVIADRLTIGAGAFVSAGAVVIRDVPAGAQVLGNPARVVNPHAGPR